MPLVMERRGRKVIAYASTTLNKAQRRYCATYRELFAAQWGVHYFSHYLGERKFRLRTDHSALRWLVDFKEPQGMVARWIFKLSEYNFTIEHRAGSKHSNEDALSRIGRTRCKRDECLSCRGLLSQRKKADDAAKILLILQMEFSIGWIHIQ